MSPNPLKKCCAEFVSLSRGMALVLVLAVVAVLGGAYERAAAEDNSAFDLKYVADEGGMVIAVRPERIFSDPKIKPLAKLLDDSRNLRSSLNFSVASIDQFVMVVNGPEERGVPHLMIRTKEKIDLEKFMRLNLVLHPQEELKRVEYRGKTYTTAPFRVEQTVAFWQPDENSVVSGTVEYIENCIDGRAAKRKLLDVDQWSKVEKSPLVIAVDNSVLKAIAKDMGGSGDEPLAKLIAPLAENIKYAVGSVNVGKRLEFLGFLECENADGAKDTAETIEALLKIAKSYAERGKEAQANAGPLGETVANVLEITMKLIDAAEITRRGREVKIASSVEFKAFAVNAINSAVTSAQLAAKRVQSANNMKQMGLAFHNYTDINKSFPPAVIVGPKGHKHSWRVAMLPYIDQKDLYDQYRFDEPWDSKNNLKVLAQMPAAYRHPDDAADSTNTAYFALVGPDTIFGAEEPISFAQVTDGTSNTIMYIEAKRAVPWTKPEDIPYDPDAEIPALGGYFPEGFNATFADGSVRFIAKDFDPELLRRMIQMSDGKPVNE